MKSAVLLLSAAAAIVGFWSWSPIRPCQLMSPCHTTSAADGACAGAAGPCELAGAQVAGAHPPDADEVGADAVAEGALATEEPADEAPAIPERPHPDGRILVAGLLSTNCCAYSAAIERVSAMQERFGDHIRIVLIDPKGDNLERFVDQWRPTWRPPLDGPAQPYVWQDTGAFRAGPGTFFIFDRNGFLVAPDIHSDELEEALEKAVLSVIDGC
ncbi:MAG: hypothetical protein LC135_16730 [Phycisphaerae bacterium]|jgi:hypothetical protein|nr:hypothetical protein [Phycisphaerae bacterium]MCZ2401486.1 hypothetical protein [Phycisphaerae bacterium]NUQ48664.1 hypothetical protein [Phycisphaerae bacterium]